MAIVDVIAAVLVVLVLIALALIIARQRHMLHSAGGIPLATRRGNRWLYGVGRYDGDELQWYRAIGIGTRPTRVLRRTDLHVVSRRAPAPQELGSLPPSAVIVELRDPAGEISIALADGAFTGFVSWLEASATQF
jgi:Protein of unknown function (DUF2550)